MWAVDNHFVPMSYVLCILVLSTRWLHPGLFHHGRDVGEFGPRVSAGGPHLVPLVVCPGVFPEVRVDCTILCVIV